MSGDERDPKNPVDESGEGKSGDEKQNDKIVGPSNKEKKGGNESDGVESDVETSDDEMSYEKNKSSSRVVIDSNDDSDREKCLVPVTSLQTQSFLSQRFFWLSHLVTICCPFHNFVTRASIVFLLMRVCPSLEEVMTPLLSRVCSRESYILWTFHKRKLNLMHA